MNGVDYWTTAGLISLAIVATVPLGLRLVGPRPPTQLFLVAAVGAVATWGLPAGPVAAALAFPWWAIATWRALRQLAAVGDTWRRSRRVDLGPALVHGWWAMAAAWLVAHRTGVVEPFGFDRVTALLTVAHFHHAGFGVTALFVAARRRLGERTLVAAIGVHQVGMVAVAAGITFEDHLEWIGSVAIVVALIMWTAVAVRAAARASTPGTAAALLRISSVAWAVPMVLALGWALGPFLAEPVVTTFRVMLGFHASIQAVGLVLCGLAGVARLPATPPLRPSTVEGSERAVPDPTLR